MDDDLKLLTADDLAKLWQMDRSTVYRILARGDIPTVKFGRSVRVTPDDAMAYMYSRRKRTMRQLTPN